ncbi:hypothetical protein [Propionispora sp. 2/2-37]|uniref:hypothetical protein n=1 Tax=Propionispora sp. 2/2-37 TaxID=1677858 RepID=UPI003592E7E2
MTRNIVLQLAGQLGIPIREEYCTPDFYLQADEAFISAATGLVPIGQIGDLVIGRGVGLFLAVSTKPTNI